MVRVGNRTMDVYMSRGLKPRSQGSVQSSTDSSDKTVSKKRDTFQIHDLYTMNIDMFKRKYDISSKSTHCDMAHVDTYYWQELEREAGNYIHNVVQSQDYYEFDDIGMSAAYAYSVLHQQIIEGHRNGTRELYVYDPTIGGQRLLTLEEELEKLDQGYEDLIEWDAACAKDRYSVAGLNGKVHHMQLADSYHTYDGDQVSGYIRKSYQEFRSRYLAEYEKSGGKMNMNMKSLFMSVLNNENQGVHDFCKVLFGKTKGTSIKPR